jgi:hypothetical protein
MGAVKVGERIYDEQGHIRTVVTKSPVLIGNRCYVMEFNSGERIVADAQHKWPARELKHRMDLAREAGDCLVEGCGRPIYRGGLCGSHHDRRRIFGSPTARPPIGRYEARMRRSIRDRLPGQAPKVTTQEMARRSGDPRGV